MNLTNQRILVTGGSSGIGLALAAAFLEKGNRVAICGRGPEALARASRKHPELRALRCDVSSEEQLRHLVHQVEDEFGGLSILVNNAGVQFNYDFTQEDPEAVLQSIDSEIGINLLGLAKATALFLPLLKREGEAAIVNVSSGLGLVPKRSAPVYCATKAAVHLFSKSLRWQMEDTGAPIRVFEILPPLVDTAMTSGRGTGKLTPEQVAKAALRAMERDQWEVRIGKVRLLGWINRILPSVAERILKDT